MPRSRLSLRSSLRLAWRLAALLALAHAPTLAFAEETPTAADPAGLAPSDAGSTLALGGPAAAPPSATPARSVHASLPEPMAASAPRLRRLAFSLDAGLPSGAGLTLVYRPVKVLRLGGSFLWNTAAYGVGASATVAPHHWIAPSFTVEGGHYFDANVRSRVESFGHLDAGWSPWLERAGYSYASAMAGLELGSPDRFTFFLRAGLSRAWLRVKGTASTTPSGNSAYVSSIAEPTEATLGLPAAKVGLQFYFY